MRCLGPKVKTTVDNCRMCRKWISLAIQVWHMKINESKLVMGELSTLVTLSFWIFLVSTLAGIWVVDRIDTLRRCTSWLAGLVGPSFLSFRERCMAFEHYLYTQGSYSGSYRSCLWSFHILSFCPVKDILQHFTHQVNCHTGVSAFQLLLFRGRSWVVLPYSSHLRELQNAEVVSGLKAWDDCKKTWIWRGPTSKCSKANKNMS